MKIVVIGTRGFPNVQGGVESHCQQLYPRLAEMELDVTVCTRTQYMTSPFKSDWKGVKFINIKCYQNKFFEALIHTALAVFKAKSIRPDIIHIHAIGPSLLVPLAKLMGLKVVITHHGPDYNRAKWGFLAKAILKLGERFGCKFADQIIAISSGIKRHIKKEFNKDAQLVPNGVEIPQLSSNTDYIKSLGLTPNKYFLAVGRFVPEKGLMDLISAFSRLKTDWKLVIAGDADHETEYSRDLKVKASENSQIILTGFIKGNKLNQVFSHAGLFVMPSYHEGLPIALLEALSYGLRVLVSDIAPNKEVYLEKACYFSVGNIEALATKMQEFMNMPLTKEEKTKQISMVAERYDWGEIADKTLQVYKQVADSS